MTTLRKSQGDTMGDDKLGASPLTGPNNKDRLGVRPTKERR
jgi:hypothetical protein